MKQHTWRSYAFWILLAEAAGALSGWLSRSGIGQYEKEIVKPPLSPPGIVFPIVWTILFALMGIGAARIAMAPDSPARSRSLRLFFLQLGVNFFWSTIYFTLRRYGLAFVWTVLLWGLILWMILSYRKVDRAAARLQVPYLLWVTFAVYLVGARLIL